MFFRKTHQFPNFKSKDSKQSFTIPQFFKLENNKIFIPKFKDGIKVKEHRKLEGKFVVATISKNCANQYYVSIIVEKEVENLEKLQTAVGIDVGIKDFAVCSNGIVYENKIILRKKEKKLKFLQRQLSKAKKASKNRQRKKLKVAKLHQYIKNSRVDYIHKISKKITDENQIVVLEDLNIAGMLKNHKLAKSISDASWHEFKRQLEYKANWKGREVVYIDRFFPSSKLCSCGVINQELTLQDRVWTCKSCNTTHNRDELASKNILRQGLLKINTAVGTTVESVRSYCH